MAFSFQSHLAEGALGYFHPHAFPMSFHSLVIWGRQALQSVKGGGGSVAFLPRTTSTGHHLIGPGLLERGRWRFKPLANLLESS